MLCGLLDCFILVAVILNAFSSPNEDVKTAASFALGAVAVGNLSYYLPFVLKQIDTQTKRQYLLLHSLKVGAGSCWVAAEAHSRPCLIPQCVSLI